MRHILLIAVLLGIWSCNQDTTVTPCVYKVNSNIPLAEGCTCGPGLHTINNYCFESLENIYVASSGLDCFQSMYFQFGQDSLIYYWMRSKEFASSDTLKPIGNTLVSNGINDCFTLADSTSLQMRMFINASTINFADTIIPVRLYWKRFKSGFAKYDTSYLNLVKY